MLQRAASNAYSWWWASHIRTKQSKWLDQSLQDMEEKVNKTIKIIDHDGDSFAKRAEMYYRRRPELISFVEESFKSYRALAERYDHLSKELQTANRKIATAFPDEVHFDVDDEDDFEEFARMSEHQIPENPQDGDGQKPRIPKAPGVPGKDFRSPSMLMSRKGQVNKQTPSHAKSLADVPVSGLTKTEALEEIDNLQKEILSLQTEKEFVKSAFERGKERYWEIEHKITAMQQRVCDLQDEFSIGIVLEDSMARSLMATTALKSCQEALEKLQEWNRQSEEEVKVEEEKIDEAYAKFQALGGVSVPRQEENKDYKTERMSSTTKKDILEMSPSSPSVDAEPREKSELELARDKMREEIEAKVTVPELADKIDELVDRIVNLEIQVSSQAALVRRLRLEIAVLLAHILSLEKEKANSPPGNDTPITQEKLKEFDEELNRVKDLRQHVVSQCQNLLSQFTKAGNDINSLSEKLKSMDLDEDVETIGPFHEAKTETESKQNDEEDEKREHQIIEARVVVAKEEEDMKNNNETSNIQDIVKPKQDESCILSVPSSEVDSLSEKPQLSVQHESNSQDLLDATTGENRALDEEGKDDTPNLKKMFNNGMDDREKALLEEYAAVIRSYKEVKSKLGEVEKKSRDSLFEMAMEIRELRNANAQKEKELEAMHRKLDGTPKAVHQEENSNAKAPNKDPPVSNNEQTESSPTAEASSGRQPLYKLLLMHNDKSTMNLKYKEGRMNLYKIGKMGIVPTVEEKLRVEIDELLEENLEFWLRFSTSFHQMQKFQTTFQDLQAELAKLKDAHKKQQEGSTKSGSLKPIPASEIKPIYKHLREIQIEIKLWFEHNTLLNEELQSRSAGLSSIQDEITRVLEHGPGKGGENDLITEYQAAKFQGEVLNMRQENNKVGDELRAGLDIVKKLQAEIEKTLKELDKELNSATKKPQSNQPTSGSSTKARIPLRSFLFGVKLKKQKPTPASMFSSTSPGSQKQYTTREQLPP